VWSAGATPVEQTNKTPLQSPDKSKVNLFWFAAGKYDIAMPNTGPRSTL
jgi:hypothetical protein